MPNKVRRVVAIEMTIITAPVKKTYGKASTEENAVVAAMKTVINPETSKTEEKASVAKVEPEKLVIPAVEPKKEMTMMEKILKVENPQFVVEKRAKLVQTRSELKLFQISSNDFNCSMRLNDTDGNVFTTSFTPEIKKVIDFLKSFIRCKHRRCRKQNHFLNLRFPSQGFVFRRKKEPFFMVVFALIAKKNIKIAINKKSIILATIYNG